MKISYLVTCKNETNTLRDLLEFVWVAAQSMPEDEVVIVDDFSDNEETQKILDEYKHKDRIHFFQHSLNNNYGEHKNWGTQQCSGDYVFQIDGDELPTEYIVGPNLHEIIQSNPEIELYFVPRVNDFVGVTPEHAVQWGWKITTSIGLDRPIVNWPDYQGRIYKRDYPRIHWFKKLHECIKGMKQYSLIPCEEESLSLWHRKTIQRQVETNLRYNREFTEQENRGQG